MINSLFWVRMATLCSTVLFNLLAKWHLRIKLNKQTTYFYHVEWISRISQWQLFQVKDYIIGGYQQAIILYSRGIRSQLRSLPQFLTDRNIILIRTLQNNWITILLMMQAVKKQSNSSNWVKMSFQSRDLKKDRTLKMISLK